ncbi:N-acetyltransferase [Chengkuizengella axinellae]|uniref:N-acetyltransferase n=1 Tax=Chengkuizengella axinellae TaxID=3064388 RepID=A0ABT9IUQ8_9BACL|nr:N-acetyltransferase [Chengkuizengella sp. 2205SS18-9]MDP5273063.1 N-acetyltransferase [Chengkuizengella sp. 2205SS18-9]
MKINIRLAQQIDIDVMFEIISYYANDGIMLPRSKNILLHQLNDFAVVEVNGEVIGCGSLCQLGDDLVEVRSFGVLPIYKGQGLGKKLLQFLVHEASLRKIPNVMALTYEVEFFTRNGFEVVDKEIFPEKVWKDCIHCKKLDCCDEIAVLKKLDSLDN